MIRFWRRSNSLVVLPGFGRSCFYTVAIRDHVTMLSIDFHVLSSKWPVPRCLDDSLRLRISHDDSGFIIYLWIDLWFDLLCYSKYRCRLLSLHQPGHEVSTITSKIY